MLYLGSATQKWRLEVANGRSLATTWMERAALCLQIDKDPTGTSSILASATLHGEATAYLIRGYPLAGVSGRQVCGACGASLITARSCRELLSNYASCTALPSGTDKDNPHSRRQCSEDVLWG